MVVYPDLTIKVGMPMTPGPIQGPSLFPLDCGCLVLMAMGSQSGYTRILCDKCSDEQSVATYKRGYQGQEAWARELTKREYAVLPDDDDDEPIAYA